MNGVTRMIREAVAREYLTPNMPAEVIIDCFLRPRLADVINPQCGLEAGYVAKEMPIPYAEPRNGNRGCKIDYVLADDGAVYLTELKTTPSSRKDAQLRHYLAVCGKGSFGEVLGRRLIGILAGENGVAAGTAGDDRAFAELFTRITGREPGESGNVDFAMGHIREKGYAWKPNQRSRKYLLTLAEILDYLEGGRRSLWGKEMRLIYLAPERLCARLRSPGIFRLAALERAIGDLRMARGDNYSQFLASVLEDIFGQEA